jgi:hypothetical protein
MGRENSRLVKNVSAMALFPILGMMGGLLVGFVRARARAVDEFTTIGLVTRGGFFGFAIGTAVAMALALLRLSPYSLGSRVVSLKGLMGIVVLAAALCYVIKLLADLVLGGVL